MCADKIARFNAAVLLAYASIAFAQESVETLVDKGAYKMTPAQIRAEIVGVETEGPSLNNPTSTQARTLNQDGTYQTRTSGSGGSRGNSIVGKWTIRDDGAICTEGRTTVGRSGMVGSCGYWYALNGQYFVVDAESPNGKVQPRRVNK